MEIRAARIVDMDDWIHMLTMVADRFPGLNLQNYRESLRRCIEEKHAIAAEKDDRVVGGLLFTSQYEIAFLAVHPHHTRQGIATALVNALISCCKKGDTISVVTYRAGDEKGIAARSFYQKIGFIEGVDVDAFGYPCQRLMYTV